ncbi:AraC family transcriptional regulator [Maribacter polysiphoniae]|uniref:AraC family transcriptional regulator n=1 Tax=Maribacter polysiphoniae TaxID=429344 RepID=A0A316E374_9FLAO|nr:helix-turn-helix transcriptional regulator [Maribacter polysiphoniae]MBD1259291.1 AraC family transcriptional regulator [Maribacter polysiphoniae]PWK24851.1 AraC-like DNA-binding protein [Maribacter polysiphoniae]
MDKEIISEFDFESKQSNLGLEIIPLKKVIDFSNQNGYDPHRLNFYQLIVITKGRGIHEVDFETIAYAENTVIPVAMGQVQRFTNNPQLKGYAVLFTPDFLIKEEQDYHYLYDYTIFNHAINPQSHIANKEVLTLLQEMITEQQKGLLFDSGEYQRNLLKNFLIQIERNKRERVEIVCNDSLNLYMRFRKTLEENINYKIRVADICQKLNVTPKQINKALKLYTNTTAKQYIEDRVILEIKRLLVYSTLTIKEIAYEIGFDDPTNFTKYFKARVNTLPTDYQKQHPL